MPDRIISEEDFQYLNNFLLDIPTRWGKPILDWFIQVKAKQDAIEAAKKIEEEKKKQNELGNQTFN